VEEARAAGHKGGSTVSQNRAHMATLGRKSAQRAARRSRAAYPPGE
jgi:hypothetical protein